MSKHKLNYPSALSVEELLNKGFEYAEANSEEYEEFNKHAKFKMRKNNMSEDNKSNKNKRIPTDQINKENFRWRTGDGEFKLEEMDLDSCLAAKAHFAGKANENHSEMVKLERSAKIRRDNTEYFVTLDEIVEAYIFEEYGLDAPTEKHKIQNMREFIKDGTMKISSDTRAKIDKEKENE